MTTLQNFDAEESILGAILLDPEALSKVLDRLKKEHFSTDSHRLIYEVCLSLHLQNKPTDLMNVTTWLIDHNQLDQVGGKGKLVQLVDRTISAVNIEQYADLVIDKYTRRQLVTIGDEIKNLAFDTSQDLPDILNQAEQKVFDLNQNKEKSGLIPIADTMISTFQELELRTNSLILPGLESEFYDLDAMTGGFQRSDLVIIAGRPAMGKTSFALNIAENIAGKYKLPIAVFSLEMSKEQLVQRLLAGEARIESTKLRTGRIDLNQWDEITSAMGKISEFPLFIDDNPNTTINQMRSEARKLQAEQKKELGLILLDYLQLMEGGGSIDNRVQELSKITRGLKGLARELNVPVIALSQLSRSVESRTNKRPMMSDLRESGSIEQDADLIIMLYRDAYYHPDTPDRDITEVIITKHRNGPTGTVKLLFDAHLTKFRNLAKSQNY
jgi:replicative DNA helicase